MRVSFDRSNPLAYVLAYLSYPSPLSHLFFPRGEHPITVTLNFVAKSALASLVDFSLGTVLV